MTIAAATGLSAAQKRVLDNTYPGFKEQGISDAIATKADVDAVKDVVNDLSVEEDDDELQAKRVARCLYDFAEHGGAIGTIEIGPQLPDNAIVTHAWYKVLTTLQSSTDAAVVGIGFPTDDVAGIKAGVAISAGGNNWDAGNHGCIQDGDLANYSEQLTAARKPTLEIATEALTAGKLLLFLDYIVAE